jgi:hypothetical protein
LLLETGFHWVHASSSQARADALQLALVDKASCCPADPTGMVKPDILCLHISDNIMWLWINTYENSIFSGLFTSILTQLF